MRASSKIRTPLSLRGCFTLPLKSFSNSFDLPVERALSMLLIIDVFALVALAIRPLKNTVSVHLIVSPVACVFSSVRPFVRAFMKNSWLRQQVNFDS